MMETGPRKALGIALSAAAIGVVLLAAKTAHADCASPQNAIEAENCLAGNPPSEWDVSGAGDSSIQGFATDISVNQGQVVQFKVKTTASVYRLDIYRLGFYGGNGARKVATVSPSAPLPQSQPACLTNATGLVDCGNWAVSASWSVPATATSGIYIARLVRGDTGGASHVVFVVRKDGGSSALLFQTSDTTWQAYNQYGGNSLYTGTGPGGGGRAYKVSYNRPFTTRAYAPEDWVFNSEYPMVRWLERNGFDVSYTTGLDADRAGAEIARHQVFLSVGHDEYWSGPQRANVEKARDQLVSGQTAPVHLVFLSGNEIFWKTRWESSIDASAAAYRTLVCYKETHEGAKIDPSAEWTGTWRDPRFSPPSDGGRPENALSGTIFTVNGERADSIEVPAADAQMRFWRNTPNVSGLTGAQVWTSPVGTLGYEWDEDLDNGARPAGLVRLSTAVVNVPGRILDYGSTYAAGTATHHLVLHKRPSGALVFGAGTTQWTWGLDAEHDRGSAGASVDMQQATVNLLADMGAQPATLQAGLLPASASVDLTAPVSDIAFPANNATLSLSVPVTIQGTATDGAPGVIGGVEVSVDGGLTWHPAVGRGTWTYAWTPSVSGSVTILSRAVDDSANLEAPGAGRTVVVGSAPPPTGGVSIWGAGGSPAVTNANDGQSLEVGVKFRSAIAGNVTAIRFYKGTADTGAHVGTLWSSTGSRLGFASFSGESASGWQQVTLASPVAIAANTTYVVSCFSSAGYYVATNGYFVQAFSNPPLTALADGTDGGNGVYKYGASGFPTQTWGQANYWVDVVFTAQAAGPDTTPPTVVGTVPSSGATGASLSANVSAGFSEPLAAGTVSGTSVQLRDASAQVLPATVTWDPTTQSAVLDPSADLAYATTYTATIKGGAGGVTDVAGNALVADVSWTFTTLSAPPSGAVSIWAGAGSPALTNQNDGSAIELGLKFRSSIPGYVTALRFYKGSSDTGAHVGNLWSATGTLLATVTFTGETASGWQEMALASAVPIVANTTYVASYHSSAGYYVASGGYFAQAVTNGPLTALADGADGSNGLYRYGTTGFPTQSYQQTNYWADVVFSAQPPGPDTIPPSVVSTTPANGASGVLAGANVTARFSEPMAPSTVTGAAVELRDASSQLVAASVAWDAATSSAVLHPTSALAYTAAYTATVKGGSSGVTDIAGNPLAGDVTWTFTTQALPPPPPNEGPGGPILVIGYSGNPFSRYYAEILRAEGLNAFDVVDISLVDATVLAAHDVAILGEMPLTASQAGMLSAWVNDGGNLLAMRPDAQLAGVLGLTAAGTPLANAYFAVDTARAPGQGIVGETMQFHGSADRYAIAAATPAAVAVATLYSNASTATANPAVTLRNVGGSGGQAAAFAFDLAKSIVYTRQGNPAWSGDERDGVSPVRSDDLFYGDKPGDVQPDWIDLGKVAIPQADELQRLLANLVLAVTADRKPLPRFWYFPRGGKAVVVMAEDNHGSSNVEPRFATEEAASPAGCSVDDWQCIRSTAYLYIDALPNDATAKLWEDKGFEVALHVNTNCADWTPATLPGFFASQMAEFAAKFPSIAPLTTNRTHCIAWSDWATQPKVELAHGIRLDTNYYYWPPGWVGNTPGFFTGSGMPMRFADLDGTMIDVYQATTQMTDESGQSYPFTIDTLLDRALGPEGYYGAFTANIHSDGGSESQAVAVINSAKARSVPVVSAKQMLTWLDGRNGSSFEAIDWNGNVLTFGIAVGAGANGLQAMVPTQGGGGLLSGLTRGGVAVPYTTKAIKGVQYAFFVAQAGTHQATYGSDTTPPVLSSLSVSVGSAGTTATVQWGTSEPATSEVRFGTAPASLNQTVSDSALLTAHAVLLSGLTPNVTYYYQVTSADGAGNATTSNVGSFVATVADATPPTVGLVAPVGGERLYTGSPYLIRWTATDNVGVTSIDVAFSADGGASFAAIAGCSGLAGTAQSCTWPAPGPATTQGRVRVTARDAAGQAGSATSANFTVVSGTPSVTLTAPNTAVTWSIATAQSITFNHNLGTGATVVIDLSRDGGATWATVNPGFVTTSATTGSFTWTVAGPTTTQARVRVTASTNPAVSDTSDVNFTISGTVSVTSPTSGVRWGLGSRRTITWNHTLGAGQAFDILLSTDGGTTFPTTLASGVAGGATSGSWDWVVAGATSTTARVRVAWTANTAVRGTTSNFRIEAAAVTVTAPNTNVNWAIGTTRSITWSHNLGTSEAVNIDESTDGGTTWTSVATDVANSAVATGSYNWLVPGPASTTARIRVTWARSPAVTDVSNVSFRVASPFVTVSSPNTNVAWTIGASNNVTFSHNLGAGQAVAIELSRDGGAVYSPIATFTTTSTTSGSYPWVVTGPATTQGRVRVTWTANPAVTDVGNANFRIQ